jgi:RES domain-containing protein
MITVWRLVAALHAAKAFTGEGALLAGGRWNSKGGRMVYTASTLSLAALEILVHAEFPEIGLEYVSIPVEVEKENIQKLPDAKLPKDWQVEPSPVSTRKIGDAWLASGHSAVLEVPSKIIPAEKNYLLNPLHADFSKLRIGKKSRFSFDARLVR